MELATAHCRIVAASRQMRAVEDDRATICARWHARVQLQEQVAVLRRESALTKSENSRAHKQVLAAEGRQAQLQLTRPQAHSTPPTAVSPAREPNPGQQYAVLDLHSCGWRLTPGVEWPPWWLRQQLLVSCRAAAPRGASATLLPSHLRSWHVTSA